MPGSMLNDSRISRAVELALMEDVGLGDITSEGAVPADYFSRGTFLCKESGVVAGLEIAQLVFTFCDSSITLHPATTDGSFVTAPRSIAEIDGNTRAVLRGERTALNFLQRMSGIATLTSKFVAAVAGTGARITDTRKTAPGLRVLDKWAVRLGGGVNHRFGLDDMVLIKDNHIEVAGGIGPAIRAVREYLKGLSAPVTIEVETCTIEDVRKVMSFEGIKRIMLDNFPLEKMREAVDLIAKRVEVEASGGVTLENVRAIAETGVDYISVGALTHSAKALDISLELSRKKKGDAGGV